MQNKNLSSQRRGTLILTFALAVALAVSGCAKKETPKPVVSNNTNAQQVNSNVNENQGASAVEDGQSEEQGEEIDTSDWQTYRNEEYGFEVKYPEGWAVIDLPDPKAGFALKSPSYKPLVSGNVNYDGEIYLSKIKNYSDLKIIDLINTFNDGSNFWPQEFPYKELLINGRESVVFDHISDGEFNRKEIFIRLNDYVFTISYLYKVKDESIEKIFNKIVEEIKFIENEKDVDTSDWQTYINKDEACFFRHPSNLIINKTTNNSSSRLTLIPKNYQGNGKDTPTYDEVKEGFKIAIITRDVPEETDWIDFIEMPGGSIGKRIYRNTKFNLDDKVVYKKIEEGRGFLNEYSDEHVLTFIAVPRNNKDKITEIWLLSKKSANDKYIDIFNEIARSFGCME